MAALDLVVTIGPASRSLAGALVQAGATALRLNAAHLSVAELAASAAELRAQLPAVPIIVDLQGAKLRLGEIAERRVTAGARVRLALGAAGPDVVPVPHPELFESVRVGETLAIDDARVRLRVLEVSPGGLTAEALGDGALRPRKGVNVLEHPVVLADLAAADDARVSAVASVEHVSFAVSFMATGEEAAWVRRRAPGRPVIGKVERRAAIEHLEAIERAVDAVWICRGDLGAELGLADMARFVATHDPRRSDRPVLIAGQVLEHLTEHASPTRAEVCHLYDLLARGYAGVVLSDETAIGHDPLAATQRAADLLATLSPTHRTT